VINQIILKGSKGEMNITMEQETRIDQKEEEMNMTRANNT
jgi:hypothetical protein